MHPFALERNGTVRRIAVPGRADDEQQSVRARQRRGVQPRKRLGHRRDPALAQQRRGTAGDLLGGAGLTGMDDTEIRVPCRHGAAQPPSQHHGAAAQIQQHDCSGGSPARNTRRHPAPAGGLNEPGESGGGQQCDDQAGICPARSR